MHLLLDFGASRIKGAIWDGKEIIRENSISAPWGNHGVIDAMEYPRLLKEIWYLVGEEKKPESVLLCTEMGGEIYISKDGDPITPYYSWRASKPRLASGIKYTLAEWIAASSGGTPNRTIKISDKEIPIAYQCDDTYAALTGVGLDENSIAINVGTGSQVAKLNKRKEYEIMAYFPAGRALRVYERFVPNLFYIAAQLNLDEVLNSDLRVDLNVFDKARKWKRTGATIENIREDNFTPRHFVASIVREMAYQYMDTILEIDGGSKLQYLRFAGGIPRRIPVLPEAVAFLTLRHLVPQSEHEETLLGLAKIAKQISQTQNP